MKLWLLIPVKPFHESKTRLAGVMDAEARATLSRQLLENTLILAQKSGLFHTIVVISRDPLAWQVARQRGAVSLSELEPVSAAPVSAAPVSNSSVSAISPDPTRPALAPQTSASETIPEKTLNHALELGRAHALAGGAGALLVLPADLPLLEASDLAALVNAVPPERNQPVVVLAPSHDGGTNALLLRPPSAIPFAFGLQSLARHRALAQAADCAERLVRTPTLMYDLDLPEDLWGEDVGL